MPHCLPQSWAFPPRPVYRFLCAAVALCGSALVSGCSQGQSAPAPPPPPPVTVSKPAQKEVVEWDEYTGHLESPEMVNLIARVSGLIVSAPFQEGALVKEGTPLFQIDPSPFQADYDSKQADVAKAESMVGLADVNFKRTEEAVKSNAVSKQDYDTALQNLHQAQAVLAGAKAALESSRLNLDWTHVNAPITGRVSRKYMTAGNLVTGGAGQGTLLTTLQSVDPMYCYVDVDERSVLKYQQLAREKKRISARDQRIPCFLALADETTFPHRAWSISSTTTSTPPPAPSRPAASSPTPAAAPSSPGSSPASASPAAGGTRRC